MALTILSVGYPLAPVTENTAGGAEQILSALDQAIVASGNRSLVIAPEGSHCRGTLMPVPAGSSKLDDEVRERACRNYRLAIQSALATDPVDVIHMHGIDFLNYLPKPGAPVVVTLHLPPSWYPQHAFSLDRPDTHLVCVSESQKRSCPDGTRVRVIRNGVSLDSFGPREVKGNYVLTMGRICPEKGYHLALEAATKAEMPLILAGEVFGYRDHEEYFERSIAPQVEGRHKFIGPVGAERKRQLLAGARCLLVPSLVEETSCLVAMEAMASGTPVIAFDKGALREVVDHGRTGFLVDCVDEMAAAISTAGELSPTLCRRWAEKNFSGTTMAQQYLSLYGELAKSGAKVDNTEQVIS